MSEDGSSESSSGVSGFNMIGVKKRTIDLTRTSVFDENSQGVKREIVRMMMQYMEDEGYHASMLTLQDESNVAFHQSQMRHDHMLMLKKAILDGDWVSAESTMKKGKLKSHRSIHFAIYKQQFLELIDSQQYQRAFLMLTKKLKPLESFGEDGEVRDMAYLLTCKSLQEAGGRYEHWEGATASRERLVEQLHVLWDAEDDTPDDVINVPSRRLLTLLQQAVAYQMEFNRYQPKTRPVANTLLEDYHCDAVPNTCRHVIRGFDDSIKSICFGSKDRQCLYSGSGDGKIRVHDVEQGRVISTLPGSHKARVWSLAASSSAALLASASADSTVKIWKIEDPTETSELATLSAHTSDVYSVCFHPNQKHIASGGCDKSVRLTDVHTQHVIRTFSGLHQYAVTRAVFNPHGNLIISGSKDGTVGFWDMMSGLCVKTITGQLSQISSVECSPDGTRLLICCRDSTNRIWDLRKVSELSRLKGHQNLSKTFIRASFGMNGRVVFGGSEDGKVYVWHADSGVIEQTLRGHTDAVLEAHWNSYCSQLATCSQDMTVRVWWYDPSLEDTPASTPTPSRPIIGEPLKSSS
eukprot:c4976_g1_i1.p1 GENE.c4976_g1_i1~~c4976_g1_i1.p1  ORF type:complete len:617 (+),score=149.73 c4976_g1_i1:115-1851(+)